MVDERAFGFVSGEERHGETSKFIFFPIYDEFQPWMTFLKTHAFEGSHKLNYLEGRLINSQT